jgi:hypothetical protein
MLTQQAQLLSDFIDAVSSYSGIESNPESAKIIRQTNPSINKTVAIVAGQGEPDSLVLPINVIWIQFDSSASDYRHVYQRDSKQPDVVLGYNHTWLRIREYKDLWETQSYLPEDGGIGGGTPSEATVMGLVRLSVASLTPGDPVVVTEGDPSLNDARTPLAHAEMHEEIPATRLATTGRAVQINYGGPQEHGVSKSDFQGDSEWGSLSLTDIYPDPTPFNPADAKVFTDMENNPISADLILS